jgi:hypothetical protein
MFHSIGQSSQMHHVRVRQKNGIYCWRNPEKIWDMLICISERYDSICLDWNKLQYRCDSRSASKGKQTKQISQVRKMKYKYNSMRVHARGHLLLLTVLITVTHTWLTVNTPLASCYSIIWTLAPTFVQMNISSCTLIHINFMSTIAANKTFKICQSAKPT